MKIAIVKLSAMGDIVHAMVALQYLKAKYPDLRIDWIVESAFVSVLEDNPHIDRILPVHLKAIKKEKHALLQEIRRVRRYAQERYDLVIDAQGLIKSALTSCLLGRYRAGFSWDSIREKAASLFYTKRISIPYDANTIDRNAKVLSEPLGMKITKEMILDKEPFLYYKPAALIEPYLHKEQKNIIFVIGSTWESRNYPKEKFAEIADALQENILIVWGNDEEHRKAQWIASCSHYATVLPKLDLNALKAVIGKSDLVIGNDTGPTHMAWGLNRPSVTIFGPTPTSRVYQTPINKVVKSDSIVDPYRLNKEDYSIREIEAKEIVVLAKELLNAR